MSVSFVSNRYSIKKMVKFGQQIQSQQQSPEILGRTRQVLITQDSNQQRQNQQVLIKEAQDKLSQAKNADEYERIYNTLSPFQQSAFTSPNQLRSQQDAQRQETISKTENRIQELKNQQAEEQRLFEQRGNPGGDERRDFNYRIEDLNTQINALNEAKGKLNQGSNLDYDSVVSYANDKVSYQQINRESRAREREQTTKSLDQRNAENQLKGFTFTGTVQESFVKDGKETPQGTTFYLQGKEVSGQDFSKQFDIYSKPSGAQVIFAKGTDLAKLSPAQEKVAFPEAEGRESSFKSQVESFPVTEQQGSLPPKSTLRKILDTSGDVLSGLFLKSSVGLGLRGVATGEPTGLSAEELRARRADVLQKKYTPYYGVSGFSDTPLLKGIKLSKDIRESGELAVAQGNVDYANIKEGSSKLTSLNDSVIEINRQLQEKSITNEEAQSKFSQIQQQQLQIFQDLASKGIKTKITTTPEGQQNISFTSKATETDLTPAGFKLLKDSSPSERALLYTGAIASQGAEFGVIGLATGGLGIQANVASFFGKYYVPTLVLGGAGLGGYVGYESNGVKGAVLGAGAGAALGGLLSIAPTLLPKTTKVGLVFLGSGVIGTTVGLAGLRAIPLGAEAGLGKIESVFAGTALPVTGIAAFTVGSSLGNQIYQERVLDRFREGGFSRAVNEEKVINGKKFNLPAQRRVGQTKFADNEKTYTEIAQTDKLREKIPGTDIRIDTEGKIKGVFSEKIGQSMGESVTKVTGKDARVFAGKSTPSRTFYFDKDDETAIVSISKVRGGVQVNEFRSKTLLNELKVLQEGTSGQKTIVIDFNRLTEKVGEPFNIKGLSLSDNSVKAILQNRIDLNRIFTPFPGEDKLYTVANTKQLIRIDPKTNIARYEFGDDLSDEVMQFQTFRSIGQTRAVRADALKSIINQITKDQGAAVFTKNLISDKGGQVFLPQFTEPRTLTGTKTFTSPRSILSQDIAFTSAAPLRFQLEDVIKSALLTNALAGTSVLTSAGVLLGSRNLQVNNQKSLQLQLQNLKLNQVEDQVTNQRQSQNQQQINLQQLIQSQNQVTTQTNFPGNPPPNNPSRFAMPDMPGFNFDEVSKVRRKVKKKRSKKELFYVQDFTSKVLDSPNIEVTPEQAVRLALRTNTGFESRPGIVIKGSQQAKASKALRRLLAQ